MGNGTNGNGNVTVEISPELDLLRKVKRMLADTATDKDQSDYMRRACRNTLHEINNVIAQIVAEMEG